MCYAHSLLTTIYILGKTHVKSFFKHFFLNLVLVDCFDPQETINGNFSYEDTRMGSIAELSCIEPYLLKGNSSYTCGRNGVWNGSGYCRKFNLFKIILLMVL